MQGVFLTMEEIEALEGLPFAAVVLYVVGLRPLMDGASGVVGIHRRVSWGRLALTINPAPHPGYQAPRVSRSAARRIGATLERCGLVRIQSNDTAKQLIFKLPLAPVRLLAQNKADTNPTQQADTPPAEGKAAPSRHSKNGQADTFLQSINIKTPPLPPGAKSTRTTPATREGAGALFVFPPGLSQTTREQLGPHLEGLTQAQEILDELGARMALGGLQYPTRYARALIKQARAGEFIPDQADTYRRARERQQRAQIEAQAQDQARRKGTSPAQITAAKAAVKKMREGLRRGG